MNMTYIGCMRRRLGLEENDPSRDELIEAMTPMQRLELICGWHLGDPSFASQIIAWAKDAGFTIGGSAPE